MSLTDITHTIMCHQLKPYTVHHPLTPYTSCMSPTDTQFSWGSPTHPHQTAVYHSNAVHHPHIHTKLLYITHTLTPNCSPSIIHPHQLLYITHTLTSNCCRSPTHQHQLLYITHTPTPNCCASPTHPHQIAVHHPNQTVVNNPYANNLHLYINYTPTHTLPTRPH